MLVIVLLEFTMRTPGDENVAVDLHHLCHSQTGTRVQIIDVLRDEQEIVRVLGKSRDCFVRSIRARIAYALPAFTIPIPNQLRVARKCFRGRKLSRV
jgi:L-2-hydroxyglutarate oxidase LhgO